MNLGPRLRVGSVAAGVILLLVGCTTSTTSTPSSSAATANASPSVIDPSSRVPSSTSSTSASPSPSPTEASSSASPTIAISTQETADRAAVEAQWIKFWQVYRDMAETPADQRADLVSSVAKSPLKETLLSIAGDANANGEGNYGEVVHHIFWEIPIDGQNIAAIGDCQDQTKAGTVDIASGSRSAGGGSRVNIRGQLVREPDGTWLVQTLVDMGVDNC